MRISCPYCGERDAQEFVYRGDAAPVRPTDDAAFVDYVYLRDNVAGPMAEHWYHAQGCRAWILVERNSRTHEVIGAGMAQETSR